MVEDVGCQREKGGEGVFGSRVVGAESDEIKAEEFVGVGEVVGG